MSDLEKRVAKIENVLSAKNIMPKRAPFSKRDAKGNVPAPKKTAKKQADSKK